MIKSNKSFTPSEYLNAILNQYFEQTPFENDIDFIRNVLENMGLDYLWDYSLTDTDEVIENNLNVVLVICSSYNNEKECFENEPRWFEVPEDFKEDE